MVEAHVEVKITDGYLLHLVCVGFTKKCDSQIWKTSYAQHQQVHQIQKKIMKIMTWETQTNDLEEMANKLIPDSTRKPLSVYMFTPSYLCQKSQSAEEAQVWIEKAHGASRGR